MFDTFKRHFMADAMAPTRVKAPIQTTDTILAYFLETFGGKSFNGGLYRTVHPADMRLWAERIHLAYPTFNWPPICFGYDWMGRAFALQSGRSEDGLPGVLMFDLGGGDAFSIPANIISFHDSEIIKSPDAALDASFYQSWRAAGGAPPAYDQCIGYRVPLFLGGEDGISNLEASDLDVYWSIFGQVLAHVGLGEEEEPE